MFVWSKSCPASAEKDWEQKLSLFPKVHPVITSEPGKVRLLVEAYAEQREVLVPLEELWGGKVREIKERNWAALSAEPLPTIQVRGKLLICDARSEAALKDAKKAYPDREVIAVPADMAFGTGHHATTATVLRMLVDSARELRDKAWTVADLGCGSGILAIAAVKLGAKKVWGCDFDAKAVAVARQNAVLNATPNIKFTKTDVLKWAPKEAFDLVAANIFFDILHSAAPQIVHAVKPGGRLMVSGILRSQATECLDSLARHGIQWTRVVQKGKWVTAVGRRDGSD